ncbi:MAG: nucleotidyltransferase [Bacilli bacterium]|nr:nucleotidyltransferase [Bacilli bacterium]
MKKVGIICEYNPFHNGHKYHIEKIKEMYPDSLIILVMSSSFTQRGDISILNKWEKTEIALNHNVDLVVELPFEFSTQGADIFAKGAISLLKELQTDLIVFGSESNNPGELIDIAKIQLNNKEYNILVKKYLDKGENYPTALSKALKDICGNTISLPNDLLGLSYVKEIIKQNANIEVKTIKRTNDFHNNQLDNEIVSASAIRNNLNNQNLQKYVPDLTYKYLKSKERNNNYFLFLKYKIITEQEQIKIYQTVDEGIHNRILKYIEQVNSLDELIKKIKTKRYTYNKLNRMFTHILCNFTKEDAKNIDIKYIRVLGFNKSGIKHLNKIKKSLSIPIITNIKKEYNQLLKREIAIDKIYSLITNDKNNNYKNNPIKLD